MMTSTCQAPGCGATLIGRATRWCSERCRKHTDRVTVHQRRSNLATQTPAPGRVTCAVVAELGAHGDGSVRGALLLCLAELVDREPGARELAALSRELRATLADLRAERHEPTPSGQPTRLHLIRAQLDSAPER